MTGDLWVMIIISGNAGRRNAEAKVRPLDAPFFFGELAAFTSLWLPAGYLTLGYGEVGPVRCFFERERQKGELS